MTETLTPAELKVFELLAEGNNKTEIATMLGNSPSTISTHVGRATKKLNAKNPLHAVVIFVRAQVKNEPAEEETLPVSTRTEILDALSDAPKGLTHKELVEYCMACENDEQIVGSMIGILHRENVIHPAPEQREGANVWIFGKAPGEKTEPPISLAGADFKRGPGAAEAARVIAGMRQTSARTRAHSTPSSPAPALTVRAKIEAALREHGPMRATDIEKHVHEKNIGNHCSTLAARNLLIRLGGTKRGTIYGLPGQTLVNAKPERGKSVGRFGVTANASPVVELELRHSDLVRREFPEANAAKGDLQHNAALLDLQALRAEQQGRVDAEQLQLRRLDRLIEATKELLEEALSAKEAVAS